MGKCQIKIFLSMNRAIVALNRMIIYCNTALTQIRISFQGTFLPKIIQRCDNFKCRSRRICSICGTVKKATVILVINEAIPVLCYGIRIKVRLAHHSKNSSGRRFQHNYGTSSISQRIIGSRLKICTQTGYHRISLILFP